MYLRILQFDIPSEWGIILSGAIKLIYQSKGIDWTSFTFLTVGFDAPDTTHNFEPGDWSF